jgi:hypothetical protein
MAIQQNFPNIRPSISLNFAKSRTLDPRITFTRASGGSYVGADGLIEYAATNEPRFTHNLVNRNSLGLLIEESKENLLNHSQTFSTSGGANNDWTFSNVTVNSTTEISPDGTRNALRITSSAANGSVISTSAISSSAQRTFSIFLRRVSGTGNIQYTLNNGSTWATQAITSTWNRYSFTTTDNHRVGIRIATSGNSIEIWGAQLETGSAATSYIPTDITRITRSSDLCVINENVIQKFFNPNVGTSYFEGSSFIAAARTLFRFDDGTSSTNTINSRILSGNTYQTSVSSTSLTPSGTYVSSANLKLIQSYESENFASCVNGGAIVSTSSGTIPLNIRRLNLGYNGSGGFLNGSISRYVYYSLRLPNNFLQSLTNI